MRISIKVKILVSIILVTIAAFAPVLSIGRIAIESMTQDFISVMKKQGETSIEAITASATGSKDDFLTLFEKDAKEKGLALLKKDSMVIKTPLFENSYTQVQDFVQKAFEFDQAILEASVIVYEDGVYKGLHFVNRDHPEGLQLPVNYDAKSKSWKSLYKRKKVSILDESVESLDKLEGPTLTKVDFISKSAEMGTVHAYQAIIPIVDGAKTAKAARAANEIVAYLRYTISLAELDKLKTAQEKKLASEVEVQNKNSEKSMQVILDNSEKRHQSTTEDIVWAVAAAMLLATIASFVLAVGLTKPIQSLSVAAEAIAGGDYSKPVIVKSRDEMGVLGRVVDDMRLKIKAITENLQFLVDEKTAALSSTLELVTIQHKKISIVMENISEGILTIGADLTIDAEHSAFLATMFGVKGENFGKKDSVALLFKHSLLSADKIDLVHESLKCIIGEDDLNWFANSSHLPRRVEFKFPDAKGHRVYDFHWNPMISDRSETTSILVTVQDMTEQLEAERKAAEAERASAKLTSKIVEVFAQKPESIQKGLGDSMSRIKKIISTFKSGSYESTELFRELHTIKGNMRTLRFKDAAEAAHKSESAIKGLPSPEASAVLMTGLEELQEAIDYTASVVSKYLKLDLNSSADWKNSASSKNEGLIDSISDDIRETRRLAAHANLRSPKLTVVDNVEAWDPMFLSELVPIIRHAFSNIVDHGFVRPISKGRIKADQPFEIKIQATILGDGALEILIDDSGAGFNTADVEALAKKQGIADPKKLSRQELLSVLLGDGASTADQLTDTSGRGVGLSAIAAFVREKKGEIILQDAPTGSGARIQLKFNKGSTKFSV